MVVSTLPVGRDGTALALAIPELIRVRPAGQCGALLLAAAVQSLSKERMSAVSPPISAEDPAEAAPGDPSCATPREPLGDRPATDRLDDRDNDLASVALLGLAALFLVTAITGAQLLKARFGGNELEFAERAASALDESQRNRTKAPETAIGGVAKAAVAARMSRNADLLNRARILWVDDHPEYNTPIVALLKDAGAIVDTAHSNSEALRLFEGSKYDVVISDVARDKSPDAEDPKRDLAGINLVRTSPEGFIVMSCSSAQGSTLSRIQGTRIPNGWLWRDEWTKAPSGEPTGPDELLHLVMDVLEREDL